MLVTPISVSAKSLIRWLIRLLIVGFLTRALVTHWHDVVNLTLRDRGITYLAVAAIVTFGAHVWVGLVWSWILGACGHPRSARWSVVTYLRTNVAKYLPGNIWHFVRRIRASQERQVPLDAAVLSVVLESVLVVAAACLVASISLPSFGWHLAPLLPLLVGIHPRFLNPVVVKLAKAKAKAFARFTKNPEMPQSEALAQLNAYPLVPLAGEVGFVVLRAVGFLLCLYALHQPAVSDLPAIVAAFAVAWVAGMVVPGAPGGIGVFEATALGLLEGRVPPGVVFGVVAAYRLISTGTEALGALVPERWSKPST